MSPPDAADDSVSLWSVLLMLLPAAVLLWVGVDWWRGWQNDGTESGRGDQINCAIQDGPCTRPLGGGKVHLDIGPRPVRAMVEHRFHLTLEDLSPEDAPYIDLNMPDMDMGYNRVFLKTAGDFHYTGTGIFPVCPSGIPTWSAEVVVPGAGTAEFIFDVRY